MSKKDTTVITEKTSAPGQAQITSPPGQSVFGSAPEPAMESRSDLDDLREIFWGNHIRNTDGRFNDLELRLQTVNRSLQDSFTDRLNSLAESSQNKLTTTHARLNEQIEAQSKQNVQAIGGLKQELTQRLDRQQDDHAVEMRKLNRELMEYVDQQSSAQSASLRQVQQEMTERIDKLATDLLTQLGQVQKDLSQQITRLNDDQNQRLNTARTEAQRRDEDIRQEMLKLTAALDDKSTARHDLGQMYMELGRRLYNG
jgi:hypothetical protein